VKLIGLRAGRHAVIGPVGAVRNPIVARTVG
jgi:hypothetical protein